MSASPSPFNRVRKPNKTVIQATASPFTRVTESDESVVHLPIGEEISDAKLDTLPHETPRAFSKHRPLYFYLWMLACLLAGVTAGRLLYLLWGHVASHDQQLAWHQAAIKGLTETRTTVSDQANHLKTLDTNVTTIQALLDAQAKKLADLEKGQTGMRDQLNGMNTRWQKQMNEIRNIKAPVAAAPVLRTESSAAARSLPPAPVQPAFDKHNETFSPDLKPAPNSYAQMLPSGLVVWMTPRPGSPKSVPVSVIGHVHGLGMLVHNWEDNKHYFITDSGSWIADQR